MSLQVVYSTSVLHSYLVQGHENNAWQDPKEGLMNLSRVLSQDRIVRLEEIGFQWWEVNRWQGAFEKRCYELKAFKEEFGHCIVPSDYADSPYMGAWC
jgi:hypothetical protein